MLALRKKSASFAARSRRHLFKVLLALPLTGLLISCGGSGGSVGASKVERVIMFGDSLSDLGTYKKLAEARGVPKGGKFTVNPGPLWIENVASFYGLTIGPNRNAGFGYGPITLGGTGYAEGGSRVALQPGSSNTDATLGANSGASTLPVKDQISAHIAQKGTFKPSDLVMVWIGANDIFRPVVFVPAPPDVATAQVQQAADDLRTEINRLKANGAEKIVVLNTDDWGKAPAGIALGAATQGFVSALSSAFNARLAENLKGASGVVLVDIQSLFVDIRANPVKYGLTNLTTMACLPVPGTSTVSSLTCTSATLVAPNANETYIYADGTHFTGKANRIISDFVLDKIAPIYPLSR